MTRWSATAALAATLLLGGLAERAAAGKDPDLNAAAPSGPVLAPVTVEVSAFWEVLDQQACPKVAAVGSTRPAGVTTADWTELARYCSSPASTRPSLELAGRSDREAVLHLIVTGKALDLRALCAVTREKLDKAGTPDQSLAKASAALDLLCTAPPTSLEALRTSAAFDAFATELDEVRATASATTTILLEFEQGLSTIVDERRGITDAVTGGVSIGGLASSMIDSALRGLAQFLVKRAELELRTYAIDKLRTIAECTKDTVRHRLVADTCMFLGSDTGTLPAGFGPGLRAAFARDLTALPARLVREAPAEGGASQLVARVALEGAAVLLEDPEPMQLVVRVEELAHKDRPESFTCAKAVAKPADASEPDEEATCLEAKASLFFAATMAREILTDGVVIRVTGDNLLDRLRARLKVVLDATADTTSLHKSLATLYAELSRVGDTQALADWRALTRQLRGDVETAIASFREARRGLATPADATPAQRVKAAAVAVRHALRGIDQTLAIADCVKQVASTRRPERCTTSRTRIPARLGDLLDAIASNDLSGVMASALDLARGALLSKRFTAYITPDMARLLSFAAELANAKTPDEAAAAIEAIAMPPGGWKEKRRRNFFSITGLVGAGGGGELVPGAGAGWKGTASLVGAVGLDVNFHTPCSWFPSVGLFVPVLDLGGLLNIGDGTTTADAGKSTTIGDAAPVGFAQVFAPGVGLRVGLGNSPLVLLFDAQVVPNGRAVTSDAGTPMDPTDDTTEQRTYYRATASLAVDVTIWAF